LPDLSAIWLSLLVASSATIIVLPVALTAAWTTSGASGRRGRDGALVVLLEIALTLPLVLPPTVVGYGLLLLLGQGSAFGQFLNNRVGIHLLFTWQSAAIAAAIMALPLVFRTAEAAFRAVDPELLEAGRTLGASERRLFVTVLVPLAYRGLLAGATLGFARALGEFGATMMVAGSLPGRTQTLPLALYNAVQEGQSGDARFYALILAGVAAVLLGAISLWGGRIALGRGDRR
jgi:molybdate transport system permease protein